MPNQREMGLVPSRENDLFEDNAARIIRTTPANVERAMARAFALLNVKGELWRLELHPEGQE